MTNSIDAGPAQLAEAPLSARLFAFALCPFLLLLVGYLVWEMAGGNTAQNPGGMFYTRLLVIGLVLTAFTAFAVLAAHRFGEHLSDQKAVVREAGLLKRIRYHEDLLRLITDNIPNILFIANTDGRFWFANSETAGLSRTGAPDLVGKTLNHLFPPRQATLLTERIRRAQKAAAPVITVDRSDNATGPHYMQTYHIPLPDTADLHKMVMVTQKDITDVIVERERQEETFRQIVDTLVAVVDRRDPYAAGHSIRVGQLAEQLGLELGLDEQNVEACRIAGSLMNIGKIQVPRSILVKTTSLDQDELQLVRKSILTSADILSLISFQVPVIPTLRQVLERYDGQGIPEKRKGENILMSARIVAVANAFVAMVSPRAHRTGLTIENAFSNLRKEAGENFDPRVVDALENYMRINPEASAAFAKVPGEMRGVMMDKNILQD